MSSNVLLSHPSQRVYHASSITIVDLVLQIYHTLLLIGTSIPVITFTALTTLERERG